MRLDQNKENICLSAWELTEIALSTLRYRGEHLPQRPSAHLRQRLGCSHPLFLTEELEAPPYRFSLSAEADRFEEGEMTLLVSGEYPPEAPPEEAIRFSRGVGFLTARLLMQEKGLRSLTLSLGYHRPSEDKTVFCKEHVTFSQTDALLKRGLRVLFQRAGAEMDRIAHKLPLFRDATFPFSAARPGQKDLMRSCFSAIRHGRMLFAIAPTGTGKTVATLYPAIRAMGCGYCEKVFYLTPKNTSANAAEDTVRLFFQQGVPLRGIRLCAKEKVCKAFGGLGDCRACLRSKRSGAKFSQAALSLYSDGVCLPTEEALFAAAARENLCPYELSLSCAEISDVVIGDYNYLFDPAVALRRFFETEEPHRYCCLVDEAHNLPERGREIFSAVFTYSEILNTEALLAGGGEDGLLPLFWGVKAAFEKETEEMLRSELRPDKEGNPVGFVSQTNLPEGFGQALLAFSAALGDRLLELRSKNDPHAKAMRALYHEISHKADTVNRYDGHFITYALQEKGETTLSLYCVDPAPFLKERAEKAGTVVYFSATLTPVDYYCAVLGGDRTAMTEEIPSPFDPDRLCITIMDKISTKLSAREETLSQVVKVILETLRGKAGNYMVFCPSFAYMERISALFRRLLPKIETLVQRRAMTAAEREEFIARFRQKRKGYLVGFCVMGGIYAEGIDLAGDSLIGAIVVGIGIPSLSPEREMIQSYYQGRSDEGKEYAYLYPGMNRVLQAAGRVIRREEDRGVLVLIDERFRDPIYRKILPAHWRGLRYAGDLPALAEHIRRFWSAFPDEETPPEEEHPQ